jgi:hypothetical protein
MDMTAFYSGEVRPIVESIAPLLVGKDPLIVGAALSDLVAMWIASHRIIDDSGAEREMHRQLWLKHCELVESLIPLNQQLLDAIETAMGERP